MIKECVHYIGVFWCLSAFVLLSGCGKNEDKVKPERKDIIQAVYASGKIYPTDYYRVNVSIPGYLKEIFVKVGDTVSVGQSLFSMKNEVSPLGINTARQNLEMALINASENSAYYSSMRQELSSAKSKMESDSIRYIDKKDRGDTPPDELSELLSKWENSKSNFNKAQVNFKTAKAKMETDLKNAKNLYQTQLGAGSDFTYSANISGKVYDILGKQGEYITPVLTVMEIGRTDDYEVELMIDEADINYIAKGQDVVYQTEAYPSLFLKGKIKQVYPKISSLNKSIKVVSSIELPEGIMLYAGATLEANIVNQKKKNALVIPRYYLTGDSVLLKKGGRKQKVKVKTGVGNVEFIEILEGITEEDEVYKK
jgi:multidrug efflux pump subunit AcrA (membrane-fusion protein)